MHRQSREAQGFGRASSGHGSVVQSTTPAVTVTGVTDAGKLSEGSAAVAGTAAAETGMQGL